jgi:hypothetical protein
VNMKNREEPSHEWRKVVCIEQAELTAADARAAKDARSVALGRRLKNKSPLPLTGSGPATVDRYRKPKSRLPLTGSSIVPPLPVPLSIISGEERSVDNHGPSPTTPTKARPSCRPSSRGRGHDGSKSRLRSMRR